MASLNTQENTGDSYVADAYSEEVESRAVDEANVVRRLFLGE